LLTRVPATISTGDQNRSLAGFLFTGLRATLQRHTHVWRTRTVLTSGDAGWLEDVAVESGASLPPPLRISTNLVENAEQSASSPAMR